MLEHSIDKLVSIEHIFKAQYFKVKCDPTLLQNVFLNLAFNARDAMPNGGKLTFFTLNIELDAVMEPYFIPPGKYIVVSGMDSGSGISEDVKNRIFEPFFTTKESGSGIGLGLSSAFGTVKQHGGLIYVTSEKNVGACFDVLLPVNEQHNRELSTPMEITQTESEALIELKTILVVDDEEMLREITSDFLKGHGHRIFTCSNGEEAVSLYRQNWKDIDIVVLDMVMPVMNGLEAFEAFEAFEAMKIINPSLQAILASGYYLPEESIKIKKEGIKQIIQKPYTMDFLLNSINDIDKTN
jgi:CheY-like chemotaxis protein